MLYTRNEYNIVNFLKVKKILKYKYKEQKKENVYAI